MVVFNHGFGRDVVWPEKGMSADGGVERIDALYRAASGLIIFMWLEGATISVDGRRSRFISNFELS